MGGALLEAELEAVTASVGFVDGAVRERFDCFKGTSVEGKITRMKVGAVNFFARKPAS